MAIDYAESQTDYRPVVIDEQLHCALSGNPISAESAYWAPPLVTTRELLTTIFREGLYSPARLSQILFADQPNVPYDPNLRAQLAARRSSEQIKLLAGLLLLIALIIVPIVVLAMR